MILENRLRVNNFSLLAYGFLAASLIYLWPSLIVSALLIVFIGLFLFHLSKEDRILLLKIIALALILRLLFLSFVVTSLALSETKGNFMHSLWRDFDREIKNGLLIADYLVRGAPLVSDLREISFEGHGYLHFGAFFYGWFNFIFGKSPVNLIITPILSLFSVIVAYLLAKEVFGKKPAIFTALAISIFPSFIIWSSTNIRMTLGILGILIMAYSLTLFNRHNRIRYLLPLLISIYIFSFVKERFFLPTLVIIASAIFLTLKIRLRYKFFISLLLFILIINSSLAQQKIYSTLKDMIAQQAAFVDPYCRHYKIYDDIVYQSPTLDGLFSFPQLIWACIKATPKGMFYFLFSPFPSGVDAVPYLAAYPFIIFWYFILFIALLGIFKFSLTQGPKNPSILYIILFYTLIFSLVFGNEGIAVRFRDIVTPFFFMFAGYMLFGGGAVQE